MIFKKNGRLYGDIESLLNECCEINQYCFQCALHGKAGTDYSIKSRHLNRGRQKR